MRVQTRLRRIIAAAAAACLASLAGGGIANAADGIKVHDAYGVMAEDGKFWAGSMQDDTGARWFCALQNELPRPKGAYDYTPPLIATPETFPSDVRQTDETIAQISYILWKWGGSTDNETVAKAKLAYEIIGGGASYWVDKFPQFVDGANVMIAEAQKNAGPYSTKLTLTADADQKGATLSDIGIMGVSGLTDALPFTLTLSGPGVFDLNGKNTLTSKELAGATSTHITATGNGNVNASVQSASLPGELTVADPIGGVGLVQSLLLQPGSTTVQASAKAVALLKPFIPTVSSDIDKLLRVPADTSDIVDTLHIGVVGSGEWTAVSGNPIELKATATLYRESIPEESALTASASSVIATQEVLLNGTGDYTVTFAGVTDPGVYYVVVEILKSNQGENAEHLDRDVVTNHNITSETTLKQHPVEIKTTMASTSVIANDPKASNIDHITISGLPDDYGMYTEAINGIDADVESFTYKLYPVTDEDTEDSCLQAEPVFTATVKAMNGEQEIKVESKTGFAPNTTYVGVIEGVPANGRIALLSDVDGTTAVTHTACTTTSEQFSTTEDVVTEVAPQTPLAVTGSSAWSMLPYAFAFMLFGMTILAATRRRAEKQ